MLSRLTEKNRLLTIIILILHVVGAVGTMIPTTRHWMIALTPLNLMISSVVLLMAALNWKSTLWFMFLSALLGYFIEVIGVKTGLIFGNYTYGDALGWKFFEVPLIIGLNWFMLSVIFGDLAKRVSNHLVVRMLVGALLMMLMDMLIEPIAVSLDYWTWDQGIIPVKNYIGWLMVGVAIQLGYQKIPNEKPNPLGLPVLIGQGIYFGSLHLYNFFQ